jgi:hypothetical protein
VFTSQGLVVSVPLTVIRNFRSVAPGESEYGSPSRFKGWMHFSVREVFQFTLLIAAVFCVAAYLPDDVRASWWHFTLLGAGFGVATLAGVWAALGRARRWLRECVCCLVAPLAGVATALDETVYADYRQSAWAWCAVTATIGLLVAFWLILAQAAGLIEGQRAGHRASTHAATTQSSAAVRRRLAVFSLGFVSLAMLMLPSDAYYDMLNPAPIPPGSLPNPNAYDDLLRLAAELPGVTADANPDDSAADERRRKWFDEVHASLLRPAAVPVRYDSQWPAVFETTLALRQLELALSAEGDRQRIAGYVDVAEETYQDLMQLGLASANGGLVVNRLIGTAFAGVGIEGIGQLRGNLSPEQRRALMGTLQSFEARWEPLAIVCARDVAWEQRAVGWPVRISFINWGPPSQATELADRRLLATLRLLVCELALAQYVADHGQPPEQLLTLVPTYLPAVPVDPFSGRALIYRAEPPKYVVYSVGFDRRDDGGRPAVPFGGGDLFLDPPADVPSASGMED